MPDLLLTHALRASRWRRGGGAGKHIQHIPNISRGLPCNNKEGDLTEGPLCG